MLDLGFEVHPFTWSNGRNESANIQARLDKVLGNPELQNRFSPFKINHLPRFRSDHSVILVHIEASLGKDRRQMAKIFRLEENWSNEDRCEQAVGILWSQNSYSMVEKCGHITGLGSKFQDHNLGAIKKEIPRINKLLKDKSLWAGNLGDIQRYKELERSMMTSSTLKRLCGDKRVGLYGLRMGTRTQISFMERLA